MHYIDQLRNDIILNCPICHGKNSQCSCYTKCEFEYQKYKANIPLRLINSIINPTDYSPEQYLMLCSFIQNGSVGLYLERGSKGKRSALLAATLIKFIEFGRTCHYTDALTVAQTVNGKWFEDSQEYKTLMNVDVLAVADVGDEHRTESKIVEDCFDNMLNQRLNSNKKTLISSSLSIEDFSRVYTKERYELIADCFKIITFPYEDVNEIFKDIRKV